MIYKLNLQNMINDIKTKFSIFFQRIKKIKEKELILLYIIGIIIYYISLIHLSGVEITCFNLNGIFCFYAIGTLILISSFIMSIVIYIIIYKKYKKYHLIIISIIYTILFIIDHDAGIIKHGIFNFISFLIITFILFLIIIFFRILIILIRNRNYFTFLLLSIAFPAIFISIKIYKLSHFSCDNWAQGLNGSFVDNFTKDYPCNIIIPNPHSCYISELGHFFDFVDKYSPNCQDAKLMQSEKKKNLKGFRKVKIFQYQ
jgi:hypothetical protein